MAYCTHGQLWLWGQMADMWSLNASYLVWSNFPKPENQKTLTSLQASISSKKSSVVTGLLSARRFICQMFAKWPVHRNMFVGTMMCIHSLHLFLLAMTWIYGNGGPSLNRNGHAGQFKQGKAGAFVSSCFCHLTHFILASFSRISCGEHPFMANR